MDPTASIPGSLTVTGSSRCPVCGGDISTGNRVECTSCDTPHHRDCFEYSGRCALYACSSEIFRVIRAGPVPARRFPRSRVIHAHGDPIHIEATRPLRSLGLSIAGMGSAFGVALTPSCASSGNGSGITGLDFPCVDLESLIFVLGFLLVCGVIWLALRLVVPALLQFVGYLIYYCDNSYWMIDPGERRLRLHGQFFGYTIWSRSWALQGMEMIHLGPERNGDRKFLALRFKNGRILWLADDRAHEQVGYSCEDLERIGRRLSAACDLPFEVVPDIPLLPEAECE